MKIKATASRSSPMLFLGMIESISHLSRSGETRARRLPAVIERKLARCQWTSGRIRGISQTNSAGSQSRSSGSQRDPRWFVTEDNVQPPECRRDRIFHVEPTGAYFDLSRKSVLCSPFDQFAWISPERIRSRGKVV